MLFYRYLRTVYPFRKDGILLAPNIERESLFHLIDRANERAGLIRKIRTAYRKGN